MAQYRRLLRKQARIESLGKDSPIHILRLFDKDIWGHTQ